MMNPYEVVRAFEQAIADWAGAPYGVAIESGSAALFLSCLWARVGDIEIPKRTYPSVPCAIIHAGGSVRFRDEAWRGIYELRRWEQYPYFEGVRQIIDGALRFRPGMYAPGTLHCLSFHVKKALPIGRGGMILTDDAAAVHWLRLARFDGREERPLQDAPPVMLGWNFYLQPEQAVQGLLLFNALRSLRGDDPGQWPDLDVEKQGYPDLSLLSFYK